MNECAVCFFGHRSQCMMRFSLLESLEIVFLGSLGCTVICRQHCGQLANIMDLIIISIIISIIGLKHMESS